MASSSTKHRPEVSEETIARVNTLAGEFMAIEPEAVGFEKRLIAVLDHLNRYKQHYDAAGSGPSGVSSSTATGSQRLRR